MISVVIPLYNKEKNIGKTIDSVLSQTFEKFELIIVDDGSTDNSYQVVKQLKDERIKIISKNNCGVSKTRNTGVSVASYQYIALLDADDIWKPTFLEDMVSLVNDFPDASLYGCSWAYLYSDGREVVSNYGLPQDFRGYVNGYFNIGTENILFNSSSVVFDKKAFFEIGMFDESLKIGEDLDLWIRFALKKRLAYFNKPLSFYSLGAENRVSNRTKSREESLVWNLGRYKEIERSNLEFKKFLDTWRFHQVNDFFEGRRNELDEAKSLLKEINLNNYAYFWKLLRYAPMFTHTFLYKLRRRYINLKRSTKLRILKPKF